VLAHMDVPEPDVACLPCWVSAEEDGFVVPLPVTPTTVLVDLPATVADVPNSTEDKSAAAVAAHTAVERYNRREARCCPGRWQTHSH